MFLTWSDSEQRHHAEALAMGDSIQPSLDLIFHRVPYWIDCFGIPLCSIVPGIPSLWNMGLEKMNKPAMSIVLPGRIPSHSLRKAATSPQQNRGVSPLLAKFLSDTAQRLLKHCLAPAPASTTVTNTTRVRQGANANDLTFELEAWGGGRAGRRLGGRGS